MAASGDIPDLIDVEVPVGGRVVIVSDLHLGRDPGGAEIASVCELAAAVAAATGPGAVVVAGNLIGAGTDAPAALAAHPRLAQALKGYSSGEGRRVVVLPGDRDSHLAWSAPARHAVAEALGAEVALGADLHVNTGAGVRKVRVEPGHRYDRLTRQLDPRNPLDSPYAQHIRNEVLPTVRRRAAGGRDRGAGWLAGIEDLDDAGALSRFIASRLVYRRLVHVGWLLAAAVAVALIMRLPATALRSARSGAFGSRVGLLVSATLAELILLLLVAVLAARVTNRALAAVALEEARPDPNAASRSAARGMVTDGWAGLVSGHTCRPELSPLGAGFYANVGAGSEVVSEYPTRIPGLGLPSVFIGHRLLSWVELEAGNDLHVRLHHARQDLPGAALLERLMADRNIPATGELRPAVVATFPHGEAWPVPPSPHERDRRLRRLAAAGLVVVGFLSLVSSMSDPLRDRLDLVRHLLPTVVPETAAAVAAFLGVSLIVLARSIRRGQRRAWLVCEGLLVAVAVLHVIKGVDVEEAGVAACAAGLLWVFRSSFQARADVMAIPRGLVNVVGAAGLTLAAGTVAVELSTTINHTRHRVSPRVSWWHAFEASLWRMVGVRHIPLPHRIDLFLTPTMATAAACLVLALLAVVFRPVVARRADRDVETSEPHHPDAPPADPEQLARARAVVARHGSGTLDYFALRPDKDFFFWGDTVVAHAIYGGVCLVSPDPIGPVAEREEAWRAFRRHVDEHGWALGGLGAGDEWLPIYRATGMHDLYVGDEAVVPVNRFTLDGGRFKGLRQAVNRVAKYGYRISFHDPAHLDAEMRAALHDVMTKSRRGDVERGFSMTLGRVFDPTDRGLLLAVVHGPAPDGSEIGPPVAFCHYVPAPGIGGYSLDLMRRDAGEHPNGLIDFAVVETIRELKARGHRGLGLNFATMRAVLAGEAGEGVTRRLQAWALKRMGDSMQIESLWKFNAKFDPDWQPRYAVYDAPENALAVAIAVARAESFWELPVIGRFLVPS